MKPALLAMLLTVSLALGADEKPVTPRWLAMTYESVTDLRYSLKGAPYPISVQALIEKLGLKGRAAWLTVTSGGVGAGKQRHIQRFAISDPSAPNGHYELEFELKEIVGGDSVNQVIRARLRFVTPEGIDFYADEIEVLEKK